MSNLAKSFKLPDFKLAKLKVLDLSKLDRAKNKDLLKLILTFCIVINDIKDCTWFYSVLEKGQKSIDMDKISPARGQICGMKAHCIRMVTATFLEFLQTIKEHMNVIKSKEFKLILGFLNKRFPGSAKRWQTLVKLATGEQLFDDKFYNMLVKIRNNGTYHYKHIKNTINGLNYYRKVVDDKGYLSLGNTFEETRIYFGDAIIQHCHKNLTDKYETDFEKKLISYLEDVNVLLRFMIEIYLTQGLGIRLKSV